MVAKGTFPVLRPSRSRSLPNLLVAAPSLGLAAEPVPTDPLAFPPGKSILDPSKGPHGTLLGVSLPPARSRCRNWCPRVLPALGKAPAREAAARRCLPIETHERARSCVCQSPVIFGCEDPMATGALCNCVCYFWACFSLRHHPPHIPPSCTGAGPAPLSHPTASLPPPRHPLLCSHRSGRGQRLAAVSDGGGKREQSPPSLISETICPPLRPGAEAFANKAKPSNLKPSSLLGRVAGVGSAVPPAAPSPALPWGGDGDGT